ncbi:PLP-dependent transferase [Xylona heveae TC161]|uniref:PLP-dependent transferase n=1 Tax=Xylona heveae (strain CBS 132557 / TC161) TaxID=1328760 RepID=A0A165FFP8_XYLHT|nr:PLP-dependent transferase [Xylona heveae TC161]KZF20923.1 PLP-dependent transferase [Xylona heveae TC161]
MGETASAKAPPYLSQRGEAAAAIGRKNIFFDVISNLWHPEDNPDGFVSLGVAENALMHEEMAQFAKKTFHLPHHSLTYGDGATGSKRLRAAVARFMNRHFDPVTPIDPEHVTTTIGVTTAIEASGMALGNPGDGFLLARPYYGAFPPDLGARAEIKVVGVSFGDVDPFGLDAIAKYEEALLQAHHDGIEVKALILCSPHNPLGRCFPKDVLIELMRFCQKYRLHLISDEIYALSIWENAEAPEAVGFTSVLSIDTTGIIDRNLIHVFWGMSKDFGANGLRIGFIISQHNQEFQKALRGHSAFRYPSSLSDNLAANVLEDDEFTEYYIRTNRQRLADSFACMADFLKREGIPYYHGSNAAFFMWADLRPTSRRVSPKPETLDASLDAMRLVDEVTTETPPSSGASTETEAIMSRLLAKKVFLASGEAFGSEEPGWFRIVFSQPRPYVEEGLRRILEAMKE